ncbi:MAG: lipid-A-disaccharide synthase-related protein [Cyanobacteria bacterium P01_A01_bin.40]
MKLLVLSNGHGEDVIAIRIIERLQQNTSELEVAALPIVGQGFAYQRLKIPLIGRVQQMPSGGFIYMGGNPLWQDLRGGLVQLTLEQLRLVRQWGRAGGMILAVGDIVPLLFAWLSRANYAFVGTAKSEYYLRDEVGWLPSTSWWERQFNSVYLPWERWLMSRSRCKAVFPRDNLTTKVLQRLPVGLGMKATARRLTSSIPAYDLGNPMMDNLSTKSQPRAAEELNVLLLPGSRMPEALRNWQRMLVAVWSVIQTCSPAKLQFSAAIAPGLDLKPFTIYSVTQGWRIKQNQSSTVTLTQNNHNLILTQERNQEFFKMTDVAIAMAGTATEQFVGLGKPVITFPGSGPQFTYAFAEAQSRLLGCSIILVSSPDQVGKAIADVIGDEQLLQQISLNGKQRMGETGAASRIAECLQKTLLLPEY